jgi:hypothetical protein
MREIFQTLVLVALGSVALSACGGGQKPETQSAPNTLKNDPQPAADAMIKQAPDPMIKEALAAFYQAGSSNNSSSGIQAQCGEESGKTFYASQGLVGKANAGWHDDGITGGETLIRVNFQTRDVEVNSKDALEVWNKASDFGATAALVNVQQEPPSFVVLVVDPTATVEVLTIVDIEGDEATLLHSHSRMTDTLTSARVFTAKCKLKVY